MGITYSTRKILENNYQIYDEEDMTSHTRGGKSKPDLVAIKENEALIIEVKSEKEAPRLGCVSYIPRNADSDTKNLHKNAKNLPKDFKSWYIHISQAMYYSMNVGSGQSQWELDNGILQGKSCKPALAFPTKYGNQVDQALNEWKKHPVGKYKVTKWQQVVSTPDITVVSIDT